MSEDARFEDAPAGRAADRPLRLRAAGPEDLAVIAALVQDAVTELREAAWMPRRRRFAILLNRFRWEDAEAARAEGRPFERVRSVLAIDGALRVRAQGLDAGAPDTVLALLSLGFVGAGDSDGAGEGNRAGAGEGTSGDGPAGDGAGAGTIHLILAGDGAFAVDVECIEVTLTDVTRPYRARAPAPPRHPDD